ncbi:MAG: putative inorganic carbon transporter subunit DabA [Pseudomonadota bacterium]
MSGAPTSAPADIRALRRQVIEHFEHILPAQAAIKDFVHHNTLHGFQQLPFPQALAAANKVTGAYGYLPEEQFQAGYRAGRISREDLEQVLNADPELNAANGIGRSDIDTGDRNGL